MSIAQGIDSSLMLGIQSAQGVIATAGRKLAILGEDVSGSQNTIESQVFGGDPNSRDSINGRIDAGGSFRMYAGLDSFPLIMKAACGELVTTLTNTHTVKTKAGLLPFLTAEVPFGAPVSKFKQLLDGVVDTVSFTVNDEGYLELNVGIVGTGTTLASSSFDGTPDDWSAESPLENMQIASGDVKLNGSSIANLTKLEFQLNNNVDKGLYAIGGAGKRRGLTRGRQSLSGTIDLFFEDLVAYNLAVAGTYVALEAKYTVAAGKTVDIVIPRVRLAKKDPTANSDKALVMTLPWRASKDGTAGSQIVVTTVNTKVEADYQ